MYVVSLPIADILANPGASDFKNLAAILTNIEKLKCDMYDNALMPVALANKLVSLTNHPSSRILQKFAIDKVSKTQTHKLSADTLWAALAYVGDRGDVGGALLGATKAGQLTDTALTVRAINARVGDLGQRIGVAHLSLHDLRHW